MFIDTRMISILALQRSAMFAAMNMRDLIRQSFFSRFFQRTQASSRAFLFAGLASGASRAIAAPARRRSDFKKITKTC